MLDALSIEDCINETCPWSGKPVSPEALMLYRDHVVGFCTTDCRDKFQKAVDLFDAIIDAGEPVTREGPPTIA